MILGAQVNGTFGFIVAFLGGLLSFISPCVLPLVPGYVSMISGLGSAELAQPTAEQRVRLLRTSALFILGFTIVFVALGAASSRLGTFLTENEVLFNRLSGAFVMLMGAVLIGFVTWRPLTNNHRFYVDPQRFGAATAPIMGMAFAFGWTPCIGAVLAPILAIAAGTGTPVKGMWLLAWYSLGLGVPFLLSALLFTRASATYPWFRRNARTINIISGAILIGFGALLFTGSLTDIANWLVNFMDKLGIGTLG